MTLRDHFDYVKGWGEIASATEVKVGDQTLKTKNIVIATGSEPASLPGVEVDEERVVTSTGALELHPLPKRLLVVGGNDTGRRFDQALADVDGRNALAQNGLYLLKQCLGNISGHFFVM